MEPTEIQTPSCEVETKLKYKIKIDIQNIEKNYKVEENTPYLSLSQRFTINFKNGLFLKCYFQVNDHKDKKKIYRPCHM